MNDRLLLSIAATLGLVVAYGRVEPAMVTPSAVRAEVDLAKAVRQARTKPITPRKDAPRWMNYGQVEGGFGFLGKHPSTIMNVLGTSALASTFAAKDVTPILMSTGRLPNDFSQRMRETGDWMDTIFAPPANREAFLKDNYPRAVALGRMHAMVAQTAGASLKWDPKVRVPMNQQANAFVLYSFAWWPVEAMIAKKEIDPVADVKDLDAWFHFWSVLGYGMGVSEDLLPTSYAQAAAIVPLLRQAQYAAPGEARPDGIPVLLGGHVRMLTERAAARFAKKSAEGQPAPKPNATLIIPAVSKGFAEFLALSPGLLEALGLGDDPAKQLVGYATRPVPK